MLIASGGKGQYKDIPDCPTISEVIRKELIILGVPESKIMEDNESGNTHQQLKFIKSFVKSRGMDRVGIVSNEWHLPRIEAMMQHSPYLEGLTRHVELISGEKVALQHDSANWHTVINSANKSEGMQRRMAIEQKGIEDIKKGKYNFT